MAMTVPARRLRVTADARFFVGSALAMWLVLALGFGSAFALGRSSFGVPALVHVHAAIFVSWTALYVAQTALAATGRHALHRRLGWLALAWLPAMVLLGTWITVWSIRRGHVPFFFTPAEFLLLNPLAVLTFAALSSAGIALRRRTQWHRRLMMSGMAVLTGPGFGRFMPVPLLIPHAPLALTALILLFPLAGAARDRRATGRVHPAWWVGIGAMLAMQLAISFVPTTAAGHALYALATRGAPAAPPRPGEYPPFPPGFPIPHP